MTTTPFTHSDFLQRVDIYIAGGLADDEAERVAFEAHAAGCPTCAASLAAAREHDMTMINLFGDIQPNAGFEDRLLSALRAGGKGASGGGRSRGRRLLVHPMVRRAAVGVAAAILLGGFGLVGHRAMNEGLPNLQSIRLPSLFGSGTEEAPVQKANANARSSGLHAATQPVVVLTDGTTSMYSLSDLSADHLRDGFVQTQDSAGRKDRLEKEALLGEHVEEVRGEGRERGRVSRNYAAPDEMAQSFGMSVKNELKGLKDADQDGERDLGIVTFQKEIRESTHEWSDTSWGSNSESTKNNNAWRGVRVTGTPQSGGAGGFGGAAAGAPSGGPGGGSGGGGGGREGKMSGGRGFGNDVNASLGLSTDSRSKSNEANRPAAVPGDLPKLAAPVVRPPVSNETGLTSGGTVATNGGIVMDTETAGIAVEGLKKQQENQLQGLSTSTTDYYTYAGRTGKPEPAAAAGAGLTTEKLYFRFGEGQEADGKRKLDEVNGRYIESTSESTLNRKPADASGKDSKERLGRDKQWDRPTAGGQPAGSSGPVDELRAGVKGDALKMGADLAPSADDAIRPAEAVDAPKEETPADPAKPDAPQPADPKPVVAEQVAQANTAGDPVTPTNPQPAIQQNVQPPVQQQMQRLVIRNGVMTFEVDGFDSSLLQITKIAAEEGGFVSTTDSEKLPNGKVKGTVTVRVPPERLDTLVLKLRGLGDLKSSKLEAQDITKLYTDIDSQLTAAKAMHERLINIIKEGKGAVKDLIAAEEQLGKWREKIEKYQGEINYYKNLVSLSTLNISLYERDIRTSGLVSETETVDMGVETDDVEKARAEAIKAIEQVKGRIVNSDLKRHDAGQYIAKIEADVTPEQAGAVLDRLKQLGRVGRLDVQRRQVTAEGTPPIPGAKVERKDTRLSISIYNLANIAPRVQTTLSMAADDVEQAYKTMIDQVKAAGGRVVTSQLIRPKPEETTGTLTFDVASEGADVLLATIRAAGVVMRLDVNQNPDLVNSTDAKRGFSVSIASIASVPPREQTTLTIATRTVADSYNKLREVVRTANGRVLTTNLNEQNPALLSATLDFEVKREDWPAIDAALKEAGAIVSRQVARSADTANTVDTKVRLSLAIVDEVSVQPREQTTVTVATRTVAESYSKLREAVRAANGRVLAARLNEQNPTQLSGTLEFEAKREDLPAVDSALKEAGAVVSRQVARSADTANTVDTKVRFSVGIVDEVTVQPRETVTLTIAVPDVPTQYAKILEAVRAADGRVFDARLDQAAERNNVNGVLTFDVRKAGWVAVNDAISKAGDVVSRNVARSSEAQNTQEDKLRLSLTITDADLLPPRELTEFGLEAADVEQSIGNVRDKAIALGGRVVDSGTSNEKDGKMFGRIVVDVPLSKSMEMVMSAREQGRVLMRRDQRSEQVPEGALARARVIVTVGSPEPIVGGEKSLGSTVRGAFGKSVEGLLWSVYAIVLGVCLVLPWFLAVWLGWRWYKRSKARNVALTKAPTPA